MDIEANDLFLFARIVEEGSLSRAAGRLSLPKSTVSRRLAALETRLGERLLRRTTRKLFLTDLGVAVLEHARRVVDDVQAATSLAHSRQLEPSGRLRVTMPGDLANLRLAPFLAEFVMRHPAIVLEVDLSARFVDLIAENFDLAIRIGPLRDDATLAARPVLESFAALYASPVYVTRKGQPADPDALLQHETLQILGRTGEPLRWVLRRGDSRWEAVPQGRATVNSPEVLMRMALRGAGIALVDMSFAEPYVASGELVRVLPDWTFPPVTAWAVFPGRRLMPASTRAFLDELAASCATASVAQRGTTRDSET